MATSRPHFGYSGKLCLRQEADVAAASSGRQLCAPLTPKCAVDGVFRTDGYVDARRFNPAEIAQFIAERLALIP